MGKLAKWAEGSHIILIIFTTGDITNRLVGGKETLIFCRTCPQRPLSSPLHRQFAQDGLLGEGRESSPRMCGENQLNLEPLTWLPMFLDRQSQSLILWEIYLISRLVVLPGEALGRGATVSLEERLWCSRHWQDKTLTWPENICSPKRFLTISLFVVCFNVLAMYCICSTKRFLTLLQ